MSPRPQRRLGLIGRTVRPQADDAHAVRRSRASSRASNAVRFAAAMPQARTSDGHRHRRGTLDRRHRQRDVRCRRGARRTVAGLPIGSPSSTLFTGGSCSAYCASTAVSLTLTSNVAGASGRPSPAGDLLGDPGDERAGARRVADARLHFDAGPAALDAAVLDQRFDDGLREIARNRAAEPEADLVDADDLAGRFTSGPPELPG